MIIKHVLIVLVVLMAIFLMATCAYNNTDSKGTLEMEETVSNISKSEDETITVEETADTKVLSETTSASDVSKTLEDEVKDAEEQSEIEDIENGVSIFDDYASDNLNNSDDITDISEFTGENVLEFKDVPEELP